MAADLLDSLPAVLSDDDAGVDRCPNRKWSQSRISRSKQSFWHSDPVSPDALWILVVLKRFRPAIVLESDFPSSGDTRTWT